jgi:hypothetical protein
MIRPGRKNTTEIYRYIREKEGGNEEVKVSVLRLHSLKIPIRGGPNWTPCKFLRMLGINLQLQKYL